MAVYVNTNYSALQGQRYLGNVQNSLTTTYQRLSSGMRINSAKDDAAGLQIADRLTSQINGLNQGNRNASDGIALAQTMEAGMDEISGMLQKIRTLAVQAANGTNTADDRKALGKEMGALATEINRISTQTTFAGKTVLNGLVAGSIFGEPAAGGPGGGGNGPTVGKTGTMNLQVGSNKGDTISFSVESVYFSKIAGVKELVAEKDVFFNASKNGLVTVDMTKVTFGPPAQGQGGAQGKTIGDVIALMDTAIATVDGMRADLGAIQNRLESSIRNQSNVAANKLMHAHVFVMLILLKSLLTYLSSPSFSRPLLQC